MRCAILAAGALMLVSCSTGQAPWSESGAASDAPLTRPGETTRTAPIGAAAIAQVDPLGGDWIVRRVGGRDFPQGWGRVNFSGGGFFTHEAGCGGGHPAFYQARADGSLEVRRREKVVIGKCEAAEAARYERILADFFDKAARWSRDGDVLRLPDSSGQIAILERPANPVPALAGRWRVVSIDGQPWSGPEPAEVAFAPGWMGGGAGCNGGGAQWSSPAPGRLAIGDFASTEMRCEEPFEEAEGRLFGALARVTGYRAGEGGRMVLTGAVDVVLERPPEPDTSLAGRFVGCGSTMVGLYGGELALDFASDNVTDQAGCVARYRLDGTALALDLDDSAACSTPQLSRWDDGREYAGRETSTLAALRPDALAFDETGRLVLRAADGRTVMLCRPGEE